MLPSREEPFGIALLEASFYSNAIVASRVGGIPKIIQDGVTGLLFESVNIVGLSEKIPRTLGDSELRQRLGTAAHARLFDTFTWDHCASRYTNLFKTLTQD